MFWVLRLFEMFESPSGNVADYNRTQLRRSSFFSFLLAVTLLFLTGWPATLFTWTCFAALSVSSFLRLFATRLSLRYCDQISCLGSLMAAVSWGLWLAHMSELRRGSELLVPYFALSGVSLGAVVTLALKPLALLAYLVFLFSSFVAGLTIHQSDVHDLGPIVATLAVYLFFVSSQVRVMGRALKRKLEDETLMEQVISALPGYVTLIDPDRRYRWVGERVARLIGISKEKLVGRLVGSLQHDSAFLEQLNAFMDGSRTCTSFEHVIAARHHIVHVQKLFHDNILVVSLDIHEVVEARRLHLEEQRVKQHGQQLQMLGQLAAGIAHEINNPLAIALGACESGLRQLSKDTPDLETLKKRLETISLANERAAKIVRSMRMLARDPSNSELSEQSLKQMLQDVFALCETKLRLQEIDFKFEWRLGAADVQVQAHPIYFTQIILNLIWNARDATLDKESPQRRIRLVVDRVDGRVEVGVENMGPPMSLEIREKIMTPFFTTKSNGTGMGLSLSRSWAESMGASLGFESAQHRTRFFVRLAS